MSKPNYLNVILTLNVVMLAILIVMGLSNKPIFGQAAMAAPNPPVLVNGTQQRRTIIAELRSLNAKIDKLVEQPAGGTGDLSKLREEMSQELWRQHRELKMLLKSGRVKVTIATGKERMSDGSGE